LKEVGMITRRDVFVALVGAAVSVAGMTVVSSQTAVMGSTVFDWNAMKAEPNKTGSVRRVVQRPTATLDELEIHITTLMPGETPHPLHQHPAEELLIVKEGTVESLVNGQLQRVGPGSIVFQASNQMHSLRNVGDTPATYHVIQWKSPGMLKK
jgi:XRE family transcriptional regulator, regulator of sulfur utilization